MSDTTTLLNMSILASTTQAPLQAHHEAKSWEQPLDRSRDEDTQGDTVRISPEGQALAAGRATAATETPGPEAVDSARENQPGKQQQEDEEKDKDTADRSLQNDSDSIQKQIDDIEEQIEEVKDDDSLDAEEKAKEVLALQTQIARLKMQDRNAESEDSPDSLPGGASNSVQEAAA